MPAPAGLPATPTVLLTTHRRDGTPVATAVSLAFNGDRPVFRTWETSGKAKRLRHDDRVEVAPCTLAGRATGPAVPARARLLEGAEARAAARALGRRHRLLHRILVPLAHRALRYRTVHYELAARGPSARGC